MRYRLRTLLIVLALGPPAIALLWFYSPIIIGLCVIVLLMLAFAVAALAVCVSLVASLGFALSLVGRVVLYVGSIPENRT